MTENTNPRRPTLDRKTISWSEIPKNATTYGIHSDQLAKIIRFVGNNRTAIELVLSRLEWIEFFSYTSDESISEWLQKLE